jgi:NAD(P)H-hydrate repair Nnr-like enzyme with NAD(P)H-hydrate dehydratase domain
VVLLKGSGSIISQSGRLPVINASGNALLAVAGSGDVLAGWAGGFWAQLAPAQGDAAAAAAALQAAVWLHGHAADLRLAQAPHGLALRAGELIECMRAAAAARR